MWCGIVGAVTVPLFGLGAFVLMEFGIAYRVSAPDDSVAPQPPTTPASPPTTLAAACKRDSLDCKVSVGE